jgi:HEAT repeat protein
MRFSLEVLVLLINYAKLSNKENRGNGMKNRWTGFVALLIFMAGLAGCSRTVEDVAEWEAKENAPKLKEALTDPKFEVRQAAAVSLGTLKAESAVGALAACLNDEEASVQMAAVESLIAISTPDTITPLTAAFKLNLPEARLKAAEALGTLKAEGAVGVLAEALNDPAEAIQLAACAAIGQIGSGAGSLPLAEKLADSSTPKKLKRACINALVGIGDSTALNALVNALANDDEQIRDTATTALIKIGRPAIPSMIEGLRSGIPTVRRASIELLRALSAIPKKGSGLVWYQLARATLNNDPETEADAIAVLAKNSDDEIVPTLLEACSLHVPVLRETAAQTLEWIGPDCLEQVMAQVSQSAPHEAKKWLSNRAEWIGAPDRHLDLYAAVTALNPDFATAPSLKETLTATEAVPERVHLPALVILLGQDAYRSQAQDRLTAAAGRAGIPLIAALTSTNTPIAEAAAEILSDRADTRAIEPLKQAIQRRLDAGESLSRSALYTALLKQNSLDAEPLVLKVRPNTERALQVFEKQYRSAKVISADTSDPFTDNEAPILFNVGYLQDNKPGMLEMTFKKDKKGNWYPSPALPYRLP